MDISSEDETPYPTQYQEVFLKDMENEYCSKHGRLSIINPERILSSNLFSSAMFSGSVQSSFDPYDLSSNDEE